MQEGSGKDVNGGLLGEVSLETAEGHRHLVERFPWAIALYSAGRFVFLNPACARLFGANRAEEMIGKRLLDFVHPGHQANLLEQLRQAEQKDQETLIEVRIVRLDGQVIDVEMTTVPITYKGVTAIQGALRDVTEQKQAAKRLRESEDLYRDLVEHSRDLICTHDLQGRILSVNEAVVSISGYDSRAFLHKNIRDFLAPEFRQEFDDYLIRIQRDGFAEGLMQVQTGTGERRVWKYHNTLRTEGVPNPVVRGMANDITELKRAAARIRELNSALEQRVSELQTLLDVIPIGIGISDDPECRNIRVNPYFARALGLSTDVNASLSAPEADRPTNFKVYREGRELSPDELPMQMAAAKGIVVSEVEVDVAHEDGRLVKLLESAAPLFDKQGQPRGAIGAFLDITDRKQAEEALKRSERDYRGLFENAHDAIIIFEPENEMVLEANRRACEMYGFSRAAFLGLSLDKISRDPARGKIRIQETLNSEASQHFESVHYRQDGTEMHLEINAALVDYKGKTAILSINRDITDRQQAEKERERLLAGEQVARAEAEAASRAKDEFLATVSHELRTPLTAIVGWAGMLRTGQLDDATAMRALEVVERNAKIQTQIIEDILDVSRIVSGKFPLHVRPVDLLSVLKAALDVVRPAADAKGIHLQMTVDASIDAVQGDPERLQQIVWNLLSNAVKFTPEGGKVELGLERTGRYAQITVRDTGRGIDREFLPHVFDRFRQADGSMTRRYGGLGLGLAIVRHLVEMHGGTVQAQSQGEGFGARFTVRLPLAATRSSGLTPLNSLDYKKPEVEEPGSIIDRYLRLAGLHVMVVDDDTETLQMITEMLELNRITVTGCGSVVQAIELLKREKPDVLVSDIAMPEADGYEFISKVRLYEAQQGGCLPAIALTAHVRVEDRMRALSAGYQMFIPKPVEPGELLAAIATLAGEEGL